jgi:hypothetical protein
LTINLSSATSFTNAAALIQTGVQGGTPTSAATVTYDSLRGAFVIHSNTVGPSSTMAYVSGSLAAGLNLTLATGAVLSQGAAIDTPAGAVPALVAVTQNWATLTTTWEPSTSDKVAFATAVSAQGQRYAYVGWDSDVTPTQGAAPASFGALTSTLNGRIAVWGGSDKAAFICGATAAIDFTQRNGRITYAYKQQAGLVPEVTNATVATNLLANGYNFYGSYATAAQQFQFLQNGQISGAWLWIDPYVNQIKLNSDLQVAFITLLSQARSIPYVQRGYDQIRAAALGPINAALDFGSIVAGVTLSTSQYAQVNAAAGLNIADTIQSQGWYLQILPAAPTTRTTRGSPPMTLWYTDGGSHPANQPCVDRRGVNEPWVRSLTPTAAFASSTRGWEALLRVCCRRWPVWASKSKAMRLTTHLRLIRLTWWKRARAWITAHVLRLPAAADQANGNHASGRQPVHSAVRHTRGRAGCHSGKSYHPERHPVPAFGRAELHPGEWRADSHSRRLPPVSECWNPSRMK